MLEVKNVTKRYGKNLACNDVSFTLEPGSLTVLLGPNGAGKSTIIKSIIGFLKFEGTITVNGVGNKTTEARKYLGYIPELPSLYPNLTVIEHMEFIARAYKLTDYKDRIDMLLKRFELDDKRKKFGDELSKGMLWDRTIIMQGGKICANVTRDEIEGSGKSLEDLFFEVTEGIEKDAVTGDESEKAE